MYKSRCLHIADQSQVVLDIAPKLYTLRIDIALANQKPIADQSQVVLDIATKLYTLDAILEYSLFSTAIKPLYSLDVILEYSKARIREEKFSTEHTTSKTARFRKLR